MTDSFWRFLEKNPLAVIATLYLVSAAAIVVAIVLAGVIAVVLDNAH